MKKKLMLFVSAMVLSLGASAQWTRPSAPKLSDASVFVPREDQADKTATYYLWNDAKQAFLCEGNDYGTRACLNKNEGREMYLSKYKEYGVWKEDNYQFNVYLLSKNRWDFLFIDSQTAFYFDFNSTTRWCSVALWNYEVVDGKLRFFPGSGQQTYNPAEQGRKCYMGYSESANLGGDDKPNISPLCTESDDINWSVVTKADYDDFRNTIDCCNAADELKAAIEAAEAENPGIDMSQPQAVYDNTASTLQELKDAMTLVAELVSAYMNDNLASATADHPRSATHLIQNPNYDGDVRGWSGLSVAWRNTIAENWSNNTTPYDIYQTVNYLPDGVYEVNVHSFFRIGNWDQTQYQTGVLGEYEQHLRTSQIYAGNMWMLNRDIADAACSADERVNGGKEYESRKIDGADVWVPSGLLAAEYLFNEEDKLDNSLFVYVTDGELTIGVRNNDRIAHSWTPIDRWRLTYYGNTSESLALMKEKLALNLKDYTEVLLQSSLKQEYAEAVAALKAATTATEIEEAYTKAMGLYYDMEKSKNAYHHYVQLAAEILPQTESLECEANDILTEYLEGTGEGTYGYIIANANLSIDELAEQEAWLKNQLDQAIKGTVEEGKDFTNVIKNADWSHNLEYDNGWSMSNWKGSSYTTPCGSNVYPIMEVWSYKTFDVSQTLTGMPAGIYELNIPAIYVSYDNLYDHEASVEIYVNDLSKNVMKATEDAVNEETAVSVQNTSYNAWTAADLQGKNCYNLGSAWPYDYAFEYDGHTLYWPQSVYGASAALHAGRYQNKCYGICGDDGVLKIGFRSKNQSGKDGDWLTVGHVTMKYMGNNADALAGLKEEAAAQAAIYQNMTEASYNEYKNELATRLETLQAATNAKTVIEAISALNETYALIDQSVALYKQLNDALGDAEWGLYISAARAGEMDIVEPEIAEAEMMKAEDYLNKVSNGDLDNETAQKMLDEVNASAVRDIIWVRGGMNDGSEDWGETWSYPLFKNAEGNYEGDADFRSVAHGSAQWGNRVDAFFHYESANKIGTADDQTRFIVEDNKVRHLDGSTPFQTFGGKWHFVISGDRTTLTATRPEGAEPVVRNYLIADGSLAEASWKKNQDSGWRWSIPYQGNGIYQGSVSFVQTSDHAELTLFACDSWSFNWTEGRLGCPTDRVNISDGQPIEVNRYCGDRKWILDDPKAHYLITYDLYANTLKAEKHDLQGSGTEEDPYLLATREDLLMMNSYMRNQQQVWFAMTEDIDMTGMGWSELNGPANVDGGDAYQHWIGFDGRNHVIRGFEGDKGVMSQYYNSFFGVLCGEVRNVAFLDCKVTEDPAVLSGFNAEHAFSAGAIAGYLGHNSYGKTVDNQWQQYTTYVRNVAVTGTFDGGVKYNGAIGAVVGAPTEIKNVFAQATINGYNADRTAGLVGRVSGVLNIENAYFAGNVSVDGQATYALVGQNANGEGQNAGSYTNLVNFTDMANTYEGTIRQGVDASSNVLNLNDGTVEELSNRVIAFDPELWVAGDEATQGLPTFSWLKGKIDGISAEVTVSGSDNVIYDLQGRRIGKAQKGVYIIGGNKVLVK